MLAAAASLLQGCVTYTSPSERIDGVVRILMHEPRDYTLLVQVPQSSVIIQKRLQTCYKHVGKGGATEDFTIYADVVDESTNWAEYKTTTEALIWEGYDQNAPGTDCLLAIHIHSATDIHGAGWNHGKFGGGQTVVIDSPATIEP